MESDIAAFRTQRDTNCMGEGVNSAQPTIKKIAALGAGHQALEKLDEDRCSHPALVFDHEPHMAARGNRRDQAHAMARTRGFDDGGFAPLTPRAPGMMIGAHVTASPKKISAFSRCARALIFG